MTVSFIATNATESNHGRVSRISLSSVRPSSSCLLDGVQCTRKVTRGPEGRCGAKYCGNCLRNRYNEDLDDIKKCKISSLAKKDRSQHAVQEGFYYEYGDLSASAVSVLIAYYSCPRCRDICNCSHCRKHKGLRPTG